MYWYAAESSTHAFVGYAFFHPRDWDRVPWFGREKREHVMEPGQLIAWQFTPPAPFDPVIVRRSWDACR